MRSTSIVFFGNERLATGTSTLVPTFKALLSSGHKIQAVIASHQDPVSRQKRDLEIGLVAKQAGVPVILAGGKTPLIDKVKNHPAEAAVLVAFGKLIPPEVINLFPRGIINIHPSLLPRLRGPTPIESAILEGHTGTGVSLMKLTAKMDSGPIYAQTRLRLQGNETKSELAQTLNMAGAQLLMSNLDRILDGTIKPRPQSETGATYTKLIEPSQGLIRWDKTASQIEREVRAYLGWPQSTCQLAGRTAIITQVQVHNPTQTGQPGRIIDDRHQLIIQTGRGLIEIIKIKPSGKKEMSGPDFIRGYLK